MKSLARMLAFALLALASAAGAADFRSTGEAATVLYDAPSSKARPLFVYGKDVPMELLVSVEGWTKVRDNGGTIGWIASKALSDRRMVLVRVPVADIRAEADDAAPLVFRAEQNVLLELAEAAPSAGATSVPGWVKVRHHDGQTGYVRLSQVFGL